MMDQWLQRIAVDGFNVIPRVIDLGRVEWMLRELERCMTAQPAAVAIRANAGSVYAARNVLSLWPEVTNVWREPPLPKALEAALGSDFGLVRALYFDKPPDRTWGLPWHRDLTIAVRDNRLPSARFSKPTLKAGVPHVEAP